MSGFSFSSIPSSESSSSSSPFSFSLSSNPNSSSSILPSCLFGSQPSSPFSSSSSSLFSIPNPSLGGPSSSTASFSRFSSSSSAPSFSLGFGISSTPASPPLFGTSSPSAPSSSFGASSSSSDSTTTSFPNLFGSSSSSSTSGSASPFSSSVSPFSTQSTPAFSFPGLASSTSASPFYISSAAAPAVSTSNSVSSSLFSSSAAPGFSFPTGSSSSSAFSSSFTASSSPAAPGFSIRNGSSSTLASASLFTASSSPAAPGFLFPSLFTASSGTTGLSFPLSTKTPATSSASQPQSTSQFGTHFSLRVGIGDEEEEEGVWSEGEQLRYRVVEQPIVQIVGCEIKNEEVAGVRQDHDGARNILNMEVAGVEEGIECAVVPCSSSITEEAGTSTDTPDMKFSATDMGVTPPSNEVEVGEKDPCENASADSEVVSGDEIGVPGDASQTSSVSSIFSDMNDLTQSSQNSLIVKQILVKYGDITMGSILKSVAAKTTFLQLVADVVHRLCNHTLYTLGPDELELIQTRTADAVTVGFHVDWLQRRVSKVIAASTHQVHMMELDELDQQIDAAKKSLMEMELRQMVWKKEVAFMKAEMEGNEFSGSNLGYGLL